MTPTMKKILKSWLLAAALCFCVTAAAERPMPVSYTHLTLPTIA